MKLLEILSEIITYPKTWFGRGASHRIYTSRKEFHKLYKVGFCKELNEWVPIFKSRPDIFVKVYGEIKNITGTNYCYVMVERVNTKSFVGTYEGIAECLGIDTDELDLYASYWIRHFVSGKSVDDVLSEHIWQTLKKEDRYLYGKLSEFVHLIKKMSELNTNIDLHSGQFGYTYATDTLKCLDY
jgi:hypothetical protein